MDQGRELERRIAAHFTLHGYTVRCNEVLVGRSGSRHEIDVLAEKADALTTYRVAVECKAWAQPIEKDVVAKLHYVLGDLALNKGIIVSLSGGRSGAERTAADLGIDLWGADELRAHLGDGALGALQAGPAVPQATTLGYPFRADRHQALTAIQAEARGRLNLRMLEQVTWFSPVWLPVFRVGLSVSQPVVRRRRERVVSTGLTNCYDALSGGYLGQNRRPIEEVVAAVATSLPPLIKDTSVHAALRKAVDGFHQVTTAAARERHTDKLSSLGIPLPCSGLSVQQTELVWFPYYVAILERDDHARALALAGDSAMASERVSNLLTAHLAHLRALAHA